MRKRYKQVCVDVDELHTKLLAIRGEHWLYGIGCGGPYYECAIYPNGEIVTGMDRAGPTCGWDDPSINAKDAPPSFIVWDSGNDPGLIACTYGASLQDIIRQVEVARARPEDEVDFWVRTEIDLSSAVEEYDAEHPVGMVFTPVLKFDPTNMDLVIGRLRAAGYTPVRAGQPVRSWSGITGAEQREHAMEEHRRWQAGYDRSEAWWKLRPPSLDRINTDVLKSATELERIRATLDKALMAVTDICPPLR
jgi:hypothetical protein